MKKIVALLLVLALVLAGCGNPRQPEGPKADSDVTVGEKTEQPQEVSGTAAPVEADFAKTDTDMFTKRDADGTYDTKNAVQIQLNGASATSSSNSVRIEGSTVVIKEEATYILSGTLNDGRIVVDAPDTAKVQIVLSGVDITSATSAALYILEADKVFLTLAEGSVNSLANGGSFVAIDDNNIDGALFSKQDLTLNGAGALTVISPAGHGIVCKDDLVITGGSYVINTAAHGMQANDSVRFTNATLTIDAGKDAVHAENQEDAQKGFIYISGGTIQGEAEGDGLSAGAYLQMAGGTIDLLLGGGSKS